MDAKGYWLMNDFSIRREETRQSTEVQNKNLRETYTTLHGIAELDFLTN